jgi:hypothetical protein
MGAGTAGFGAGDEVYGLTNPQFTAAASVPVVAETAWQMLLEYGRASAGKRVLIQGAAGNVGAYAVQMAADAGLEVFATAGPSGCATDLIFANSPSRVVACRDATAAGAPMKIYNLPRNSEYLSRRLIVLIAVVACHVLVASVFISGLDDDRARAGLPRGPNAVIPIPVVPSGELIPI